MCPATTATRPTLHAITGAWPYLQALDALAHVSIPVIRRPQWAPQHHSVLAVRLVDEAIPKEQRLVAVLGIRYCQRLARLQALLGAQLQRAVKCPLAAFAELPEATLAAHGAVVGHVQACKQHAACKPHDMDAQIEESCLTVADGSVALQTEHTG